MQNGEVSGASPQAAQAGPFSILHSAFCLLHSSFKEHRFPLAILFLLALTLFLPALLTQQVFVFRDHADYFQPLRWFTTEELKAGRLPLWNPYNASGEPWLANPQTGVFYPPAWLFLVLPFATAYMLHLLFHVVLLGWGAYLLFARKASKGAALVGAAALMFAGPTLSLLDISNNLATYAWIPLVLWCALERAPVRGALALALAFLAGEPFFAGLAALLFVIASRRIRDIAIAGIGAFGIAAVQLLPFLEMLRGSDRAAGLDDRQIFRDSMPLSDWIHVATFPRAADTALDPRLAQHFIPIVYVGVLVVLLALAGLAFTIRRRETHAWLALLVFAALVGSGPALLAALPLTLFRYPARLVPIGALAIVALAVAGWDRLRRDRRWLDLLVVLILAGDLLFHARPLLMLAPFSTHVVPYSKRIGAESKILRVGEVPPHARRAGISGYMNLYDRRYDAFTAAPLADHEYLDRYTGLLLHPTPNTLALMPIGWVVTTRTLNEPFDLVSRVGEVSVYHFRGVGPMAWMRHGRQLVPAHTEIAGSRAVVTIDSDIPGTVVLTQRAAPGWTATLDGKPVEDARGDKIFRTVAVPEGRHQIVWTYRPRSLFIGAAMTCVTLLSMTIFGCCQARKRRKFFFRSRKF